MWNRQEIKRRARNILSATYWNSLAMSVIFTICKGGFSFGTSFGSSSGSSSEFSAPSDGFNMPTWDELKVIISIMAVMLVIFAVIFLVSMVFKVFVANPMELSTNKFFIQSAYGESKLDYITHGFKRNYANGVKIVFLRDLFISLWSLLFVILGIVKSYEYTFVAYILAENPDIEYKRAFEISKAMTDGQKWKIFVFDLSFIGWYLLGALACGLGILFINPYVYASKTQLYLELKGYVLANGAATDADFAHYRMY